MVVSRKFSSRRVVLFGFVISCLWLSGCASVPTWKELSPPNTVCKPSPQDYIMVLPTREPGGEKTLQAYRDFARANWPGFTVVTDEQLLTVGGYDNKNLLLLGTPSGNRLIGRLAPNLPLKIEPGRLTARNTYTGNDLSAWIKWPYPGLPSRRLQIGRAHV